MMEVFLFVKEQNPQMIQDLVYRLGSQDCGFGTKFMRAVSQSMTDKETSGSGTA